MEKPHFSALNQAPAAHRRDDVWARVCCEQAWLSQQECCYPVGAVLVNSAEELVCCGRNQVFEGGYHSHRHAEMEVLTQLEADFPTLPREELTLYVSLEPCLMCFGRILLAGIKRVRYLTPDAVGGFTQGFHFLPPVWRELHQHTSFEQAYVDTFWSDLAQQLVSRNANEMREKTAAAWQGKLPDR